MRLDASVVTNESYNNGCSVIYANAASKYIEMAQWSVSSIIKKGEDYMFSFMAKGSGSIDAFMWSGSNLSIFAEDSERDTTTSNADGGRRFYLTSEWKRFWVHWRSDGTGIPNYVLIRCIQGGKAWVTMPKLEVGATPTDWIDSANGYVEDSGIVAKLLRTGLDIENGKITATADNFEVRNNSGEVTARVNEKGVLEVNSGLFSGFVKKNKKVITPATIEKYLKPSKAGGYLIFDFALSGSYMEFQGNYLGQTSMPVVLLPFVNTSDSLAADSLKLDDAWAYIGQTIIIKNRADNLTIRVRGGGSIDKNNVTVSSQAFDVGKNQTLFLTCELVTVRGNSYTPHSYKIVWNGVNYG